MIVKKPGYMFRACIAWFIWNAILLFTLAVILYLCRPFLDRWYVMIPLLVAIVGSEWIIMAETIAPVISDWIKQEESIQPGEKPSWKS